MSTVRVLSTSRAAISRLVQALRDQAHDLDLAAREPRGLVLGGGAAARAARRSTRRARRPPPPPRRPAAGRPAPSRSGGPRRAGPAAASRSPVAASAAAPRTRICARSKGMCRPACSSTARANCATAASASPSASAVSAIAQASAASASSCWAEAAIEDSASVHARASARRPVAREPPGRPAQAPDGVVVVLAALPAREHGPAVLLGALRVALLRGEPGQRRGAVALHRDDVEPRRRLVGSASAARRPRAAPAPDLDRAQDAVGDERLLR